MAKVDIDFKAENQDTTNTFKTKGIRLDNQIIFSGDNEDKHRITLMDNQVRYQKKADSTIDFIFEENRTHVGVYKINEGSITLDIKTLNLDICEGFIYIKYQIMQNKDVLNTTTIHLTFNEPKEK